MDYGSLNLDALRAKADALALEINVSAPDSTFIYAVHGHGTLPKALHFLEDDIYAHPAGQGAQSIVNRNFPENQPSTFLGLMGRRHYNWLNLQSSVSYLALISLNVDQHTEFDMSLFDLYRQTWFGLELIDVCRDSDIVDRIKNRPIAPKRGPMATTRLNLRADIFAVLMMETEGYVAILNKVAKERALYPLKRMSGVKPDYFLLSTTQSAVDFSVRETLPNMDPDSPRVEKCAAIAREIADATTDDQIRKWWEFCGPAQDMAWRGFRPEAILGAALYTSEDPYIRSIAHLIHEQSGIRPTERDAIAEQYNPFIDFQRNMALHQMLIERTFEFVLDGDTQDSTLLLREANRQNRDLLQGKFLGWCASALQSAARAFDRAMNDGISGEQAARVEFQSHRDDVAPEKLHQLTNEIIRRQRKGDIVMIEELPKILNTMKGFELLGTSIDYTLRSEKQELVQEQTLHDGLDLVLMPNAPQLAAAAPKPSTPTVPSIPMPPSMPKPSPFSPGLGPGATPTRVLPADAHLSLDEDEKKEK